MFVSIGLAAVLAGAIIRLAKQPLLEQADAVQHSPAFPQGVAP